MNNQSTQLSSNQTSKENTILYKSLPLSQNMNENIYSNVFNDYIRSGAEDIFTKSISDKTDQDGAAFIPNEFAEKILDQLKFLSPLRSIAKATTISTNSINIIVDSLTPDAKWAADQNTRDDTDTPTIEKIKINVHEVYAKPKADQKLLDDAQINVEEWLTLKISEKIATLEDSAFINGDGNTKPKGILSYPTSENEIRDFGVLQYFSTYQDGAFKTTESAIDTLTDIVCSIKPVYAKNAVWIMSRSALAEIRKLKNKDNINIWQPAISKSTPPTLLGFPVIIDDNMPQLKKGTKSTPIAFGDFYAGYQIIDRHGLQILRDPYTSKPFVEFYTTKRTGGAIVDFDAIKLLKFEHIANA